MRGGGVIDRWDTAKQLLAKTAASRIIPGMTVGIGSGSTVAAFIDRLSPYAGQIQCVAASKESEQHLREVGIDVVPWKGISALDFSVDGADVVNGRRDLIKGGGAALVRERLVLAQSQNAWILVDGSKPMLIFRHVIVPIAIVPYASSKTIDRIKQIIPVANLRCTGINPVVTDDGLYIVDAFCESIDDAGGLHRSLKLVEGVADTGLFVGYPTTVLVSDGQTVNEWPPVR